MRQIILDTETTGVDPSSGDKIIEIGAVVVFDRKVTDEYFHQYIQPERDVPEDAIAIHGITNEFLVGKPVFSEIVNDFMTFIQGAELIIHNAPFDVGFINHELSLLKKNTWGKLEDHCTVTDTLKMARKAFPGQRNSLDALCKRFGIDNTHRTLHGALLDSEILADVYLMMTGGQTDLLLSGERTETAMDNVSHQKMVVERASLKIIRASDEEITLHQQKLKEISEKSGQSMVW